MANNQAHTIKLRISATGSQRNAMEGLDRLTTMASNHEGFEGQENSARWVEICISGFYDTLLAMAQGRVTVEEMRDFFFHGDDVDKLPFVGTVIKFSEGGS